MRVFALALFVFSVFITFTFAQIAERPEILVNVDFDTGFVSTQSEALVLSKQIYIPDVEWIRIKFDEAKLAPGATVRITALDDDSEQHLDHKTMEQWSKTSAYFNGDELLVELLIPKHTETASRVLIKEVWSSPPVAKNQNNTIKSICSSTDRRTRSNYAPDARLVSSGYCSAWLTNHGTSGNRCFLTAGHCGTTGSSVVQFNVPDSTSGGSTRNPPASDQYPVQAASIQSNNGGTGNDYCVFGAHPNSETGLSASNKQGNVYTLNANVANVGTQARICGYGSASGSMNLVQKVHSSPLLSRTTSRVTYRTDTTGGNSGSAVSVATGSNSFTAYGIHTHGGCTTSGSGSNSGTWLGQSGVVNVLSNPRGICATG